MTWKPPTYRDWRPGDGITCGHAAKAPREIPCGPPVRTALTHMSSHGREVNKATPVCVNHSDGATPPSVVMVAARKAATERLIVAHWDEYQESLRQAVADELSGARGEGR